MECCACLIHYMAKNMWTLDHGTGMWSQSFLGCYCVLKHYNSSSLTLTGPHTSIHTASSMRFVKAAVEELK